MAKQKHYVVWVGNAPGIYESWVECKNQVDGFTGAKYKSFDSRAEAEQAYKAGWKGNLSPGKSAAKKASSSSPSVSPSAIDYDSISVDVGTSGNPGPIEYKGVDTRTGEVIFSFGPISKGTNNLGEFLAIVHALAYLKKAGSGKTVYSDSRTALKWVKQKQVATSLVRDESTRDVWTLVDRAVHWLQTNSYNNKLLKWETSEWGEIKADYGRK